MVMLRNFSESDAILIQKMMYFELSEEFIRTLVKKWNTKQHEDRYYEMFGIFDDERFVGNVSLYQHTSISVSAGIEIFKEYRQLGYGSQAVSQALDLARKKCYHFSITQVRTNNTASIALHKKLGFEIDHTYINRKGNEVFCFTKSLC